MIRQITKQRLGKSDHFRSQINASKRHVAYLYNAIVECTSIETAKNVRNQLAKLVNEKLEEHSRTIFKASPEMIRKLREYVYDFRDPETGDGHDPEVIKDMVGFYREKLGIYL